MATILCITIRFIQPFPLFHGRRDAEQPEWPPSPMRAFQAIVNAASLRASGRSLPQEVRQALQTLEVLRPQVIAPRATASGVGYRAYVPHNQTDLVSAAWHRGDLDATIASHRIEKDFRPMHIETLGDDLPTLHYLYPLDATTLDPDELLLAIRPSVRAITHLGWGIDQVAADATLTGRSSPQLTGERWLPSPRLGRRLRVHRNGSLNALTKRHDQFLNRLTNGWTPVSPFTDRDVDQVRYRRETDALPRPYAVFKLLDDELDTARYPHALLAHIAAVVRHAAIDRMREGRNAPSWISQAERAPWVNRFVRGKNDPKRDDHQQISYVPLPSIGHEHADAMIRNVMLIAPIGREEELEHVAKRLDDALLQFKDAGEGGDVGAPPRVPLPHSIQRFTAPRGKFIDKCYLGRSKVWQSVTPVILDEHIDKRARGTGGGQKTKYRDPEDFRRADCSRLAARRH